MAALLTGDVPTPPAVDPGGEEITGDHFTDGQGQGDPQAAILPPWTPDALREPERRMPPSPESWVQRPRHRRGVPRAVLVACAGASGLALAIVASKVARTEPGAPAGQIAQEAETLVAQEGLEKRVLAAAEDFRAPEKAAPEPTAAPAEAVESVSAHAELEILREGRRRRLQNPELDWAGRSQRQAERRHRQDPGAFEPTDTIVVGGKSSAERGGARIPAGTTVMGALGAPLVIEGGSSSVVMRVGAGQPLPAGTLLIGTASAAAGGRVEMLFRTLVLPTGEELRIHAEAQSLDGEFGLVGRVEQAPRQDEGSVADAVSASRTARLATAALVPGGYLGAAADDLLDVATGDRRGGGDLLGQRVRLGKGQRLKAFFHSGVDRRDQ